MLAMRAKSLDLLSPELYEKIKKYSYILREEGVKTKEEAEKIYC